MLLCSPGNPITLIFVILRSRGKIVTFLDDSKNHLVVLEMVLFSEGIVNRSFPSSADHQVGPLKNLQISGHRLVWKTKLL